MKRICYFFMLIFILAGCQKNTPDMGLAFDDVLYVDKFPKTFKLEPGQNVGTDEIGLRSFRIYDSLLILSTTMRDGIWAFYSLDDYECLGRLLKRGHGPNEFANMNLPLITEASLLKEDSTLFAYIYNRTHERMLKVDITKSLNEKRPYIEELGMRVPTTSYPFIFSLVMLDKNSAYLRGFGHDAKQQIRSILSENGDSTVIPSNFSVLNKPLTERASGANIFSSITSYQPERKMMVESLIMMNNINIFSVENDFGRTICVGDELDAVSEVEQAFRWRRDDYTYGCSNAYRNFFGALYIGMKSSDWEEGKGKKKPTVQLFDWNGNPLAELKLPDLANRFDIDFKHGYLYTLDVNEDVLRKYDIKHILTELGLEE